ncbi:MAG: SpoIIE family protein phosphatase [Bacteroidaceae bacterium]|nr:SpoIIE family protein phosphatase [Bacteroidaceae bacterium]
MKLFQKLKQKSLHFKTSLAVIVTAAVLVEVTSAVQYWFAREGIRKEVEHRAESELKVKNLEIQKVMTAVEVAVRNMAWSVEQHLARPDSMYGITQKLLKDNEVIAGSAIAFEPYYYQDKGRQFSPYSYKDFTLKKGDTEAPIISKQLGTDQYDYHTMEWYTAPKESGQGYWSEPYFDEGGGELMMSTYSLPIRNEQGNIIAIFTADVSLDWLGDIINAHHIYPSSYNLMISRTGQLMACPVESLVMRNTIQELTEGMEDTTVRNINQHMMAGVSGQATVRDDQGRKNYVFYAPIEGGTGWSMAVVCADKEIYQGLRQVAFNLLLMMLLGMGLLGYIIYRAARSAHRLADVSAEKERIGSELRIASGIQMAMLPKIFPPYPDRDDIDIFGQLTPAKEVGGDLYDFYIRDEKLFFCIGDVSGKGVPASLVMAVTRSLFRTVSAHESMPDRIIATLNDAMAEDNEANMFVTLFVGVLDLPTGRLRYSNAGHDAPLIICKDVERLPVDANIPVGLMQGWKYTTQEAIIAPQTTLFLYTDGLTEAENIEHQLFGEQRIIDVAHQALVNQTSASEPIIHMMTEAAHAFVGEAEQSDDLTMLAIRYTKQQPDVRFKRSITLSNDVQEVPQLAQFVEEVCEAVEFDPATTMSMNLAIEEAVVNVMNYAYPAGTKGDIDIEAQANDVRLKFTIIDSGTPFDPTAKEEVDTTLTAEERSIGGLGIHLVRQLMDSINYERVGGKNILTLRKKIQQ